MQIQADATPAAEQPALEQAMAAVELSSSDPCRGCTEPTGEFKQAGFVRIEQLVPPATAAHLAVRLERVLRGEYDTGVPPDKRPKVPKGPGALGFSGERRGARTVQMINVWKADSAFAALARSPTLGRLVAQTAGWASGARLAQDQVWATIPNPSPSPGRTPRPIPKPNPNQAFATSPNPSPLALALTLTLILPLPLPLTLVRCGRSRPALRHSSSTATT